jgi:hypothetical protein
MPNGTLKLYNKLTNALLVSLDILGTFNIEENLNETPSNMKVKVITSNTYREEFQVNTVAYHEDTNSWWVIKSDESTYLTTGEYEHEIQLVEYLEFYAYRHLPNCAFAPNTYDLEDMLNRLFDIAKLTISVVYPTFLDKDKIMPFFSFENFTVANAIKNIARAINAIPKMSVEIASYILFNGSFTFNANAPTSPSNGDYWYSTTGEILFERVNNNWVEVQEYQEGTTTPTDPNEILFPFVNTSTSQLFFPVFFTPILTFINRNGIDASIKEGLDDEFPIAYEKNMNSSDQFTTRSVSNITNAKSSSLVIAPKSGGFKNVTPNSSTYVVADSKVLLPSKIDRIEFVRIFPPIKLIAFYKPTGITETIYESYYINTSDYREKLIAHPFSFRLPSGYTTAQKEAMANNLPNPLTYQQVNYNAPVNITYNPSTSGFTDNLFFNKMSILNKFDFDTLNVANTKNRTIHWSPFTEEMIMPLSFRDGLFGGNDEDHNRKYRLYNDSDYEVYLIPSYTTITTSPFAVNVVKNDKILIQVGYYPIADIKVSIDNDNDAQDEKFFNQSGKVIDAVSVSKLITSHTNDSVEGTKIRNARHFTLNDILPLGQLVRDNNQLYVISQRSIDGHVKNGNEYYNVIYTLSRNRVARSENIVADSSVISYKTPDDNLVNRSQLYKDYIELSLVNNNQEAPYLPMSKALVLSSTLVGTNFDFTVVAKNEFGTTPTTVRYLKSPTTFDLHKAKLMNVNWQSNNVLGFRLDSTGSSYVQTPIVYTDALGKATNFELLFLDSTNLVEARNSFNFYFPAKASNLIPFEDLTQVDVDYYNSSVLFFNNYSMRIKEDTLGGRPYKKDPFEIPVFEYMIQGNDDYNQLGNIVIGNDLFTTFTGDVRYRYVINNTTRFTAENAEKLYSASIPPINFNRVTFTRDSGTPHIIDLDLFNTLSTSIRNTSTINNVGIYAFDAGTSDFKFLFAINDYAPISGGINDNSNIRVYINNWKI